MFTISFNGTNEPVGSIEDLSVALERYADHAAFELWLAIIDGASICMLRSAEHSFLMHLRFPDDSGLVSGGPSSAEAAAQIQYTLSNGQVDEYPQSWCIPVGRCFDALRYFFANKGQVPSWVSWHES
jgi:hypothetical protein